MDENRTCPNCGTGGVQKGLKRGDRDDFHFVWKHITGNFIVSARADFIGAGVDPHRKFGWMVRTSLDSASANINAAVHGDGLTSLQFRRNAGAPTEEARSAISGPDVVPFGRTYCGIPGNCGTRQKKSGD